MEQTVPEDLREVAERVFGDRLPLAVAFQHSLATEGVERGLIGPRETPRLWERHILNCAVVADLIDDGATVVDIGTGAGLPAVPIAIARPDLTIRMVEPLLRRTRYIGEVNEELGLGAVIVRGRAEQSGVVKEAGGADYVTSRAVAPLKKLVPWSLPLVHTGGRMLAIKGSSAPDELERSRADLEHRGAADVKIVRCGEGLLETPTTVVSAQRAPRRSGHGR